MNRPNLIPENSVLPKHTIWLITIGLVLYTLYLIPLVFGSFLLLDLPQGINAAMDQLFIFGAIIAILIIDILLPIRFLRKTYSNGLTRFRSLTTLIFPTLTGIRVVYFAPIAIYNIVLVGYFYYQANSATKTTDKSEQSDHSTETNTENETNHMVNHESQRKADDLEENSYNPENN